MTVQGITAFDEGTYPFYQGDDLGVSCQSDYTYIKQWAPTAESVELRIYKKSYGGKLFRSFPLFPSDGGTWARELEGSYHGLYYTIRVRINGLWLKEQPDPYACGVGVNGLRGAFINQEQLLPKLWGSDHGPQILPTDAVIYELHVRDFSISPYSGMQHKGKYLALTEQGTVTPGRLTSGLDHLVELGITHIHFLPVFDFFSVDERNPNKKYNWGYDPQNYNALEGSFATDPYNAKTRIIEFRKMVMAIHARGIGIIMDVVYNHTCFSQASVFNQMVPGYYYRYYSDGRKSDASGCGNELATERPMVRRYIIDSLLHWMKDYHVDGFRFDLMGCYDLETMRQIRKTLQKQNPFVLLYGEGWTAGQSALPSDQRALKKNIRQLPGIAAFSDNFRDAAGGSWGNAADKGFAGGKVQREETVKFVVAASGYHPQIVYGYVGAEPWSADPVQCVNYLACHDNYTFYDRLRLECPDEPESLIIRRYKLAGALLFFSQGIPFMQSGMEFMRTKRMNPNSYRSPDFINQIEWEKKDHYAEVNDFYKELIAIRKAHPAFRMPSSDQVHQYLSFLGPYVPGLIAFELGDYANGDSCKSIIVLLNAAKQATSLSLGLSSWKYLIKNSVVNLPGIPLPQGEPAEVDAISVSLLVAD